MFSNVRMEILLFQSTKKDILILLQLLKKNIKNYIRMSYQIVNYRFKLFSYEKKKYEYHRECFELLFVQPWLAVGIPSSEATDDSEKV